MMALAFLTGGIVLYFELKRKENTRQIPVQKKETVKGVITVHPYQLTGNIVLIAAIFGIIGSKIFDLFENIEAFIRDPLDSLFSFSGLTFYGGLIVAAVAVIYYCHRNKISFPDITDAISPSLILAYGIGRIGCQLAGDGCWGIVNPDPKPSWMGFLPDWVWSFRYPHNVIDEGIRMLACDQDHCFILANPVYPTPLYEAMMCLIIFIILWLIRKHLSVPGYLFSVYLILNGVERFFIEKIRINTVHNFAGNNLTQAEFIAVILILLGCFGFYYFYRTRAKKPAGTNPRRNQ